MNALTKAAQDVLAERQRQISVEGWHPDHDDGHNHGEMALAAGKYAGAAGGWTSLVGWPWAPEWWKPGTPRRMLVKAGALILAEIERLDRAAGSADGSGVPVLDTSASDEPNNKGASNG
jgi:hypothetical protein